MLRFVCLVFSVVVVDKLLFVVSLVAIFLVFVLVVLCRVGFCSLFRVRSVVCVFRVFMFSSFWFGCVLMSFFVLFSTVGSWFVDVTVILFNVVLSPSSSLFNRVGCCCWSAGWFCVVCSAGAFAGVLSVMLVGGGVVLLSWIVLFVVRVVDRGCGLFFIFCLSFVVRGVWRLIRPCRTQTSSCRRRLIPV